MNTPRTLLLAASLATATFAYAAVTPEEARQLGSTLTEFGAIKAGNADGSIPAYTSGLTQSPAAHKPGGGRWADPYKDEKPLYRIDGKNFQQYAERLSEGQKHLLKSNPGYYMDVYPTHRTAAYPAGVLKATVRNATACSSAKDGLAVDTACRGGIPFPIPKNGKEVLWNLMLRYLTDTAVTTENGRAWLVDANGKVTMVSDQITLQERPYYQVEQKDRDPQMFWRTYSVNRAPARLAGEMTMLVDYLDTDAKPRRAFSYSPGQRRVKQAPEFSYDTPVAQLGGLTFFDELFIFSGKMDRFDFKLVGKKEMLIPYNNYRMYGECPDAKQFSGNTMNPACERWELHRTWVVEATLKPGMRHANSRRTYFLDEDGAGAGMFDAFDGNGALFRTMFQYAIQLYDMNSPWGVKGVTYDVTKRAFLLLGDATGTGFQMLPKPLPEVDMTPEGTVGRETVR